MFSSLDDKCSSTDSNNVDNDARNAKKRRHLTIKSVTNEEDDTTDWKPSNWEKTLQNIREMCKDVIVPLDYMGFDQSMDPNESPEVNTEVNTYIFIRDFQHLLLQTKKNLAGNSISSTDFIDTIRSDHQKRQICSVGTFKNTWPDCR